jgi:hypothetical protein
MESPIYRTHRKDETDEATWNTWLDAALVCQRCDGEWIRPKTHAEWAAQPTPSHVVVCRHCYSGFHHFGTCDGCMAETDRDDFTLAETCSTGGVWLYCAACAEKGRP